MCPTFSIFHTFQQASNSVLSTLIFKTYKADNLHLEWWIMMHSWDYEQPFHMSSTPNENKSLPNSLYLLTKIYKIVSIQENKQYLYILINIQYLYSMTFFGFNKYNSQPLYRLQIPINNYFRKQNNTMVVAYLVLLYVTIMKS